MMKQTLFKLILAGVFSFSPLYISVHYIFLSDETTATFIPELTLENVYKELIRKEIQHPEIVIRQVIAETQWLKCRNCSKQFGNLFGFTTKNGYLKFDNWVASVTYYKQWQDAYYKGGDYYQFLHRIGYATAPNYIRLLKQIRLPQLT